MEVRLKRDAMESNYGRSGTIWQIRFTRNGLSPQGADSENCTSLAPGRATLSRQSSNCLQREGDVNYFVRKDHLPLRRLAENTRI